MQNLSLFINDDSLSDLDPLVKLAIIHHQFESIHPFYDGNGRTGRIINILPNPWQQSILRGPRRAIILGMIVVEIRVGSGQIHRPLLRIGWRFFR
jgi:hypothetical protein